MIEHLGVLRRIAEHLEHLAGLARAQLGARELDYEQLVTEYVALRKSLAQEFRALAEAELGTDGPLVEVTKRQISQRMAEQYGGRIPDRYLKIRGYSGVHPILLEYLRRHVNVPVSAARLRVLTGDQVHTERRLRELRDLGFDVTSIEVADDDHYILRSAKPDLDTAARYQAERNIREDRTSGPAERELMLAAVREVS